MTPRRVVGQDFTARLGDHEEILEAAPPVPRSYSPGSTVTVFAWFHWVGVIVGSALVSLAQRTIWRGMGSGIGFGLLVGGVFVGWLVGNDDLSVYLEMGRVLVVSIVPPLVGALRGALTPGIR